MSLLWTDWKARKGLERELKADGLKTCFAVSLTGDVEQFSPESMASHEPSHGHPCVKVRFQASRRYVLQLDT